jgi:hypothetical protein
MENTHIPATRDCLLSNACCLAPGADALIHRQPLSERSELGCPPQARIRPLRFGQGGRHGFWLLLPEQKWLGCRAEPRQRSYMLIMPVGRMMGSNMSKNIWKD